MAETSVSGSGQALQRAAKGVFYQEAGRWILPAVCALAMTLAGILGLQVTSKQDEIARQVQDLTTKMAVVQTDISYIKEKVRP